MGLISGVLLVALAWAVGGAYGSAGAVSRSRVALFARRQELRITVGNGNAVIAYLAVTRRWRTAGLVAGLTAGAAWNQHSGHATLQAANAFAGWFVGAVAAEWLVARPSGTRPRRAVLVAREARQYLPTAVRRVPPLVAGVCAILAALAALSGTSVSVRNVIVFGAIAVATAVVTNVAERRVLRRPQPLDTPDALAADDAIRSRSLHMLAGSATTITLLSLLAQASIFLPTLSAGALHSVLSGVTHTSLLPATLAGYWIAIWPYQVRRLARVDATASP